MQNIEFLKIWRILKLVQDKNSSLQFLELTAEPPNPELTIKTQINSLFSSFREIFRKIGINNFLYFGNILVRWPRDRPFPRPSLEKIRNSFPCNPIPEKG